MFIVKGSTRIVRCFPSLGIVIKTPIECLGDFGVKANKAEIALWEKTHHPLLAPVFSTPSGNVVMPYYPEAVRDISDETRSFSGTVTKEFLRRLDKEMEGSFSGLTTKIFGCKIFGLFGNGHDASIRNFRLTNEGKLVMVDYGISYPDHQEKFLEFLGKYGQKLVDEYVEPPL